MKKQTTGLDRLTNFAPKTLFPLLPPEDRHEIEKLFGNYAFTFQEFRQLTEIARDLEMWGEGGLHQWLRKNPIDPQSAKGRNPKERFWNALQQRYHDLKARPKTYRGFHGDVPEKVTQAKLVDQHINKKIFGWCPVASEKTVCCNLRTIDAVETCAFGCSYCTIQTFYSDRVVFDADLKEKLKTIEIDPKQKIHITTGQSSDSLVWGNRNGMLDALMDFAREHPNVLLEFKTKSANIGYFLENDIPPNVQCTWSLNPQVIVENEEHYTVSPEKRLQAAERVAQKGVKVGFHFHPMIYYDQWETEYPAIARDIMNRFDPESVLFISLGSVTMIKPVMKQIRRRGFKTKILQMELVPDPHGKWTYPDDLKIKMFRTMYQAFTPWHEKVFFYLCMEKASIWEGSFGYVYPNNDTFEKALLQSAFAKIEASI